MCFQGGQGKFLDNFAKGIDPSQGVQMLFAKESLDRKRQREVNNLENLILAQGAGNSASQTVEEARRRAAVDTKLKRGRRSTFITGPGGLGNTSAAGAATLG